MRKAIAALSVVLAVLLSIVSCKKSEVGGLSGGGGIAAVSEPSGASTAERAAADAGSAAPALIAGYKVTVPAPGARPPLRTDRMIIRTATVSMVVGDTLQIIDRLTAAVEANGGYVNDSKIWREGEQTRATLSLRVPAAQLTQTLAAVRKLAVRVQSENVSSEEVTQEYVDLGAELRNDEAAEVELRELMTEIRQRAKKAQDVLEIHEQLRTVRASIEKTKGRMQYLSQMSSYSTINLELVPDAIAKPVVEPGWQPVLAVKDASRALVSMLQSLAVSAIWIAIYVLPLLAIFALGLAIVWRVLVVLKRRTSGMTL
jgi:glycine cleavage system regulatory protein